jgi:hypothetical protein
MTKLPAQKLGGFQALSSSRRSQPPAQHRLTRKSQPRRDFLQAPRLFAVSVVQIG